MKKRRISILAAVAVLALAAAGIRLAPAPDRGIIVTDWIWGGGARAAPPGLGWSVPLLTRRTLYESDPFEVSLLLERGSEAPALRPVSREGVAVRLTARMLLAPDPARILTLHARAGPRYREASALASLLARSLRGAAAEHPYNSLLSMEKDARRSLESAMATGAAETGLKVLRVIEISAWPEIYPEDLDPGRPGDRKILLVGLDGADWSLIDPLIARGLMPNLARIARDGVRARLRSITPILSPIVWTSIATGKKPEKHGIIDFLAVDARTGEQIPVTSTMRRARAFWGILSGRGITNGTVGWWATWPAEAVSGFQVSDRVAYQLFGQRRSGEGLRGRTYPESLILPLAPLIEQAHAEAAADAVELLGRSPSASEPDEQALQGILDSVRIYHRCSVRLLREYRPRVMSAYYEGTDTVAHLFMRYAPPRMAGVTSDQAERWGSVVERYYLLQDRLIGELIDAAGEGRTVIVVSDHGFASGSARPQTDPRIGVGGAADWHRKYGVFAASGPGIRRGSPIEEVSVLDVTPTILELLDLPAAADMDGTPIEAALDRTAAPPPGGGPAPIASYEAEAEAGRARAEPRGEAEAEVEREMIAKLTALGYIGQKGPNAMNNTGINLLQQGRIAEAAAAFSDAIGMDPKFTGARVNLARTFFASGKLEEALRSLQAIRAEDPNAPEVDNLIGNIQMERRDLAAAEATFRRALERDVSNPHLWNSLGIVLSEQNRPAESMTAYRRVIEIDPDYAEAINNIGLLLRAEGKLQEAAEEFRHAIRADPEFPGSYNNLGLTYQDAGDQQAALRAYDDGLRVDQGNPIIHNNRGSALMALGRPGDAKEAFEKAIASDPNYASAVNNLGAALGILGDAAGEFEHYLKAIEIDPDYDDARFNLALNLRRRGRTAEAEKALKDLLSRAPDHLRARFELAALQAQDGRTEEAIAGMEKLRALAPKWAAPRAGLARLYSAVGRAADASREARASLALDANQPADLRRIAAATSGSTP